MSGMSVASLLLRAMLCLGLVLNGSGHALAVAPVQGAHAAGHALQAPTAQVPMETAAADDSVATADTPCHLHKASPAGGPAEAPAHGNLPAESLPSGGPPDHVDCCGSAACCACMQGHAGAPASACCEVVAAHARNLRPMQLGYASPTLPHLIRPPIA